MYYIGFMRTATEITMKRVKPAARNFNKTKLCM